MSESFMRFAGTMALVNAGLTVINLATVMIFFAVGGFWGTLNDGVSVFWALSFIPLVLALYRLTEPENRPVSLLAVAAGIGAMIVFASLQAMLTAGLVSFEQTVAIILTMTGILGLSLAASGILVGNGQLLPSGLAWLTLALGAGFVVGGVGFWIGSQDHPLAMVGFLTTGLIGPLWALWLGRILLNGSLTVTTTTSTGV